VCYGEKLIPDIWLDVKQKEKQMVKTED